MRVRIAVALVAVGFAAVLGGCAGAEAPPGDSPGEFATTGGTVLADAVTATEQAGSARISGSITSSASGGDMTAALSGVHSFNPQAMDVTLTLDQGVVRQVMVDGQAYVQLPELAGRWVTMNTPDLAGTISPLLSGADLSTLPEVTPDGTGTADGTAVTFYKADLDLGQALQLAGLTDEARGQLTGQLAADPGAAVMRIGVDDAGRMAQFTLDTTVNLASGSTETSTMDLRYYDFGVATDISAPAPDQVVDSSALQDLGSGE